METISVDLINLMDRSRSLLRHCSAMERHMKELCDVANELGYFWKGEADEAFAVTIGEDVAVVAQTISKIRIVTGLITIAFNEYQRTEREINMFINGGL